MPRHYVRPEAVWERSSLVVERAGRHSRRFLRQVEHRLRAARLDDMRAAGATLHVGARFGPGRPALVIRSERFPDVHLFVTVRPAGVHLEVVLLTAIEPGWLKRAASGLVACGAWWAWSLPTGVSQQEELRTLLTVVETAVRGVASATAMRLWRRDGVLPHERGTAFDQWN